MSDTVGQRVFGVGTAHRVGCSVGYSGSTVPTTALGGSVSGLIEGRGIVAQTRALAIAYAANSGTTCGTLA